MCLCTQTHTHTPLDEAGFQCPREVHCQYVALYCCAPCKTGGHRGRPAPVAGVRALASAQAEGRAAHCGSITVSPSSPPPPPPACGSRFG